MNLEGKQILESKGFQVIEGAWDFKFKTRTFIRHPDGRLNPYYDYLYEIPWLPYGQEIDLDIAAMPYDEVFGHTAVVDAGAVTHAEAGAGYDGRQLPIPLVGWIAIVAVFAIIAICVFMLTHPEQPSPPCKTEERIIDISECAKIIIMPNCDSRLFDACTNEWLEEDWHTWEPPAGWMQWLVIGLIAIGGIIIVPKVIDWIKPKPPPR